MDAKIEDRDDDGNVDNVTITADEPVRDDELDAADFEIDNKTPDNIDTLGAYDEQVLLEFDDENELTGTDDSPLDSFSATVVDLNGNESTLSSADIDSVTDNAEPVVTDVSVGPAVVNSGNAPSNVDVTLTFSEDVNQNVDGSFEVFPDEVRQGDDGRVTVNVNDVTNNTLTGTTDSQLGDFGSDYFAGVDAGAVVNDTAGNDNIGFNSSDATEFDRLLDVDRVPPELSDNTITTLDTNEDGQVDQLEVEFNDDINDDTVDPGDFTVTSPNATVNSVETGDTVNDNIGLLNVSGLPEDNTSVTPTVTVAANSIEDTAGNTGPAVSDGETQESVDGASPIVTGLTVNGSESVTFNDSDTPTSADVNVTFSEGLDNDPSVDLTGVLGISTSPIDGDDATDGQLNLTTDPDIDPDTDETNAYVNVSTGSDAAGNELVTFNESRITADTQAPGVTLDLPTDLQAGTIDISDNVTVTDAGDTERQFAVNRSADENGDFEEIDVDEENFNTTEFEDGDIALQVTATDTLGNENNTTGTLSIDNTAPDVSINKPAQTTAAPTDGTLNVNYSVTEPNIAGDATFELTDEDGNTAVYNASVSEGDNDVSLKLNVSENASADTGERLPDLNKTDGNFSFDTQTLYDLSVTVDDKTGESTTTTLEDALFLDDTDPATFSLFEPSDGEDDAEEYQTDGGLQIAYGYTEDNTDEVEVSLTNESGAVANVTVDESQYENDGVVKSFELDLFDSFDNGDLADGRYNVSVTVTDLAGNELVDATDNAPVAINNDAPNVAPSFDEGPDASAAINESENEVAVDVTYNISVDDVEDAGNLDNPETSLDTVTIDSADDLVTLDVYYYDESADKYVTDTATTGIDSVAGATIEDESVTETDVFNIAELEGETSLTDEDRVLDYSVKANGQVTVTAESSTGDATDGDNGVDSSATFVDQDVLKPELESVEVVGADVYDDSRDLRVTFTRPVEDADGTSADDFGYQDASGDGANFVTDVSEINGDTTLTVTLDEPVTGDDVGEDVLDIQPDVLQNTEDPYPTVSADSGTINETTAPAFTLGDVDVGEDASTVDVEFDQPVVAAEGGALTADNFNYSGEASVDSVEHSPESSTVTVYLDSEVTSTELGSESIEAYDISDRFDNVANDSVTVVDETSPSDLEILEPTEQQIVTSDDLLDVSYQYVDNVPDNVESAEVKLESQDETYIYSVNDTSYVTNVSKSLTLDLDAEGANLTDGAYDLNVTITDADDNTDFDVTKDSVVVNDDAPNVENVEINGDIEDIAPDSTIEVEYDYSPAPNATSVTVWVVDTDEKSTYTAYEKDVDHGVVTDETLTVDLAGEIADNDNYDVFVTATDVDNKWSSAEQSSSSLDVNAENPKIVSVEGETADNTVTVQFNEDVRDSDDDEITRADFAYQNVNNAGAASIESVSHEGDTVTLYLNKEVMAGDLGNDKVNARSDAIADTDEHDQRLVNTNAETLADTTQPVIFSASAESGSDTVTVGFSEQVYGDNGSAITAENLTYDGDNEIVEVEHDAGDRGAIVTLNESVTDGDMAPGGDTIAASEETPFVDSVDNEGTGVAMLDYQLISDFEATSDEETVTVSFNASNELSSTEIVAYNIPILSLEEDRLGDHKTTSLSLDDFEEENGTYTGTFEAPRDGTYYVDMWSVVDVTENSQYGGSDSVTVDTETVSPDEAVIYDVAGSEDNKETKIRVTFTEPINGEDITRDDVSIEGIDDEDIRYVSDYRPHGAINVHVEDDVNTGDSPNMTIDGDSYTALSDASETGAEDGSATIITDRLDLAEGTNFVSVPAAAGSLSLDEIDTSDVNAIWTYDAAAEKWHVYDPEAPDNDLDALEGGVGYIIEMDDGTNATWDVNVHNVPGEAENVENSVPNSNDLTEGWNLIGHYQEHDQTVETGLSSMSLENNEPYRLYAQADGSATMEYQSFQAGDFENMERGEAYWVFVQDDETYTEAPAVGNDA